MYTAQAKDERARSRNCFRLSCQVAHKMHVQASWNSLSVTSSLEEEDLPLTETVLWRSAKARQKMPHHGEEKCSGESGLHAEVVAFTVTPQVPLPTEYHCSMAHLGCKKKIQIAHVTHSIC